MVLKFYLESSQRNVQYKILFFLQNIYPCLIPDSIDSFAQELHSSEVEALSIVVSFALEEPGVRLVEIERTDHK